MNNPMLQLVYQDLQFEARESDKYVNASQICKYFGKKVNDFLRLKQTKRYIEARVRSGGIPAQELVLVEVNQNCDKNNFNLNNNTYWFHHKLIIKLARWLDVDFEVWCDDHLEELLTTGKTQLDTELEQKRQELTYMVKSPL